MKRSLLALAVLLTTASSAFAVVATPSLYYDFDNPEGQSAGSYDGYFTEMINPGDGLHLYNNEFNGAGGQPISFIVTGNSQCPGYSGCEGGLSAPPNEHYVGGAPNTGGGTAHHFQGGTSRTYDSTTSGSNDLDVQQDTVITTINDIFSRRDMGRLGGPSSGDFPQSNSSGDGFGGATVNGGVLVYNMWLNVQLATSDQDNTRFGSGSSFVIGRGSGNSGGSGFGGEVSLRDADGVGGTTDYRLQFRNDGGSNSIQQSAFSFGNGEWHHFLIQYDLTGAEGEVTLWIDGGPLEGGGAKEVLTGFGNGQIKGTTMINQVAHPGAQNKETGDFFLDDLAIWNNHFMTDADAQELFNNGVAASIGAVPEPSSFVLASLGLLGLGYFGWRKRRS